MDYLYILICILLLTILIMVLWLLKTSKKIVKTLATDPDGKIEQLDKIIETNRPHFLRFIRKIKWVDGLSVLILTVGWMLYVIFSLFPDNIPALVAKIVLLFCTVLGIVGATTALLMRIYTRRTFESLGIPVAKSVSGKIIVISHVLTVIVAILIPIWLLATFQYLLP